MSSPVQSAANNLSLPPGRALRVDSTAFSIKQVRQKLVSSHYYSLREVGCEPVDDYFVLWGNVTSYYAKQLAQALAGSIVGLARIKNRIVVKFNAQSR
jgi:hypothetical protein